MILGGYPHHRTMKENEMPGTAHTVTAPCGCELTVDWPRGDRRLEGAHGRFWIVRKSQHTEQYRVDKETFPS